MEKELADVRAQREKDIEATNQKGYDNGYDEATTEYKGQGADGGDHRRALASEILGGGQMGV